MVSPEQECVPFVKPVDPKNQNIEFWMGEVRDAMIGKATRFCRNYCNYELFFYQILI